MLSSILGPLGLSRMMDLVEEFQGWERRSSGKCTILLFFLRKRGRWAFSFLNKTVQAWDPPTFRGFFGLIFPTKRVLSHRFYFSKNQRGVKPF